MTASGPPPKQLPLFHSKTALPGRAPLGPESERCQEVFRRSRIAEGAHPRSVAREVSQLRALARECAILGGQPSLAVLLNDIERLAQALLEPSHPIARATGRARLLAAQRFIRIVGPMMGRDPAADEEALDALLPCRPSNGWHARGTIVAGMPGLRRRRGPVLDGADLQRIVDQAGASPGTLRGLRDRALVALHCFSGLRTEEIIGLRWDDLRCQRAPGGYFGLTARVDRRGVELRIFIPGPAAAALRSLADDLGQEMKALNGPVFRARSRSGHHVSYRTARGIVVRACRCAGIPAVDSTELRSAYAAWLRAQGLSDHEVADVLGLARVRSVDSLLRRHAALSAQRAVRERIVR